MDLEGKKVTVVGLGKSGIAACNLLVGKGAKVSVSDCSDSQLIQEYLHSLDKKHIVDIEIGRHTEALIEGQDLVVTSPGVPFNSLPLRWARAKGISVIAEIELAFAFCPAPIVAITGTNGKTTVSTLVGQIFRDAGRKCVICGNIGNPFSGELPGLTREHTVVLEVSSFQLETIDKFKPHVAVILNITNDHLDRHANFDEYFSAKCRIFSNQDQGDWAVLNEESRQRFSMSEKTKARVLYFSKDSDNSSGFGNFNSNHCAALAISSLFSIPKELAFNTCRNFKGIEHRLEEVAEIKGVKFINDSKATNVDSTLWALNTITKPIILIAGGRDKGSNFAIAAEKIKERVKAAILFGEAKEKIKEACAGLVSAKLTANLEEATREAFYLARAGDCVLFSPMCASFDMFSSYAQRGRVFKQIVQGLRQS